MKYNPDGTVTINADQLSALVGAFGVAKFITGCDIFKDQQCKDLDNAMNYVGKATLSPMLPNLFAKVE